MSLNPEFQRNLWLQLSLQRLIAAPVVIGLLFAVAHLGDLPRHRIGASAVWIYYFLVALWGTRRAAESVAEEVAGGTWDAQRMSALGAWSMSWGKLLGGTVFVWYCAGLVLVAYVYGAWQQTPPQAILTRLAMMIGTGLLGQAVAMAACLTILGRGTQGRRLPVTMSQVVGLVVVLQAPFGNYVDPLVNGANLDVTWYGLSAQTPIFGLLSLAAFLAWALVGVYRLMRVELQYRSYPFLWIGFLAFLMVYAEGFLYAPLMRAETPASAWLIAPIGIGAALTYGVLFLQPKDIVRYRWLFTAAGGGEMARALTLVPLWLPTFAVTAVLAIAFAVIDVNGASLLPPAYSDFNLFRTFLSLDHVRDGRAAGLLAGLCFMARDIALVLFMSFNRRSKRADIAAFIFLVVLYAVLPSIFGLVGAGALLPLLVPAPWAHPLAAILPPAIEAAIMIALLAWRMAAARPVPMAAAAH